MSRRRRQALARTNFAAVYAPLPGNLTVYQNLHVFGMIYCVRNLSARIEALIDEFDLRGSATRSAACSRRASRRACAWPRPCSTGPACCCWTSRPRRSIPPLRARVRAKIRELAAHGDTGVLWTSHNMYEVEEVCDRVLFLSHGKILLEGDPQDAARRARQRELSKSSSSPWRASRSRWRGG